MIFFFNDTATTEIYTLSLHDALPIFFLDSELFRIRTVSFSSTSSDNAFAEKISAARAKKSFRSEEHTSELQSRQYLVCRLLLEKKKNSTRSGSSINLSHVHR